MNTLVVDTLSTFGVGMACIALVIIGLTLFFKFMSLFESSRPNPVSLSIREVVKENTWVTVFTSDSRTFEHVRFVGFTSEESFPNTMPYDLHGMVVIEDAEKKRVLVRSSLISMIIVEPEQPEQPVSAK